MNMVGLTVGETYLIRAYNTNGNTVSSFFDLCVSAPPLGDIGQNPLSFDAVNAAVQNYTPRVTGVPQFKAVSLLRP